MSVYCNNCFCCGYYLVPRYKRLVNNLFPPNPHHGLDKNNLERLRFYAVQKPEKLEKSFRYMSDTIARYLRHRNRPYVILGIRAMTDTMKSCYQQLNTFIDSYLATLHLLLEETDDLELAEHAIDSFEAFCEIRIEAPNYQRDYEFFVDRFTQFCHDNDSENKLKFRYLGLRGHQALIRKTAGDELHNDVWRHMNQIVPSIVFNMTLRAPSPPATTTVSHEHVVIKTETVTQDDLSLLAETVLRDLFSRVHLSNIPACVQPLLSHLDDHGKWIPVQFPIPIFSAVMNSIKRYSSYVIIDLLLSHLERYFEKNGAAQIRTAITNVIHQCLLSATTSTGAESTLFAGISRLLKCLQKSLYLGSKFSESSTWRQHEERFQDAVVNGIKDFAEKLLDFQKMEMMNQMITLLPSSNSNAEDQPEHIRNVHFRFQLLLLELIQAIATDYQNGQHDETTSIQTTFPHQLLDPLLKTMTTSNAEIRLIVLNILISLIDNQHCAQKFRKIRISKDSSVLNLSTLLNTVRRVDISFMSKYGSRFLFQLRKCLLLENNTKSIFYAIFCLMNLVTLEDGENNVRVDMIHFCLDLQTTLVQPHAEDQRKLPKTMCFCVHALIVAFLNLLSKLYQIAALSQYVEEVIHNRETRALHLLPASAFHSATQENLSRRIPKECLFSEDIVVHTLSKSHYDISRFNRVISHPPESDAPDGNNNAETDTDESISSQLDLRQNDLPEETSYDAVRQVLNPTTGSQQRQRLISHFRTGTFQELKSLVNEEHQQVDQRIEQVLNVAYASLDATSSQHSNVDERSRLQAERFTYPELFLD